MDEVAAPLCTEVVAPASNLGTPAMDAVDCEAKAGSWTPASRPLLGLPVPGSPPPVGLVVSEDLRGAIECMADSADVPMVASKAMAASLKPTKTDEPKRAAYAASWWQPRR